MSGNELKPHEPQVEPREPDPDEAPVDTTMALVSYGLLLAQPFTAFTALISVVIAYIYRGKGPAWLDDHYRYQIRTFWIGLLYGFISSVLVLVVIGAPLLVAVVVWLIIRCIKGFKALQERRSPDNLESWLI
ncbi:DUF4870 family protein [Halomonas huangheensis]|uniref:DUF4870 domain-containing protein n=1 Tax=Halomonas huangheensis TaxID=1178482 RepID=W1N980_9GAMM|nr:DUF4870 domain-containing protein [Halomonas huangheensis]ALM53175.1 hypothetical protein AR456_13450 [Halomonas huangheensis]ERL51470.1 hypothetical protein BJB45_13705 [Halomonas huangheensis]